MNLFGYLESMKYRYRVDCADVWHDDPDVRELQRQKALQYLSIAKDLQAKTLRIDMGVMQSDMSQEQFEWVVKRFQEYAQFAHDHGFRIGPQTHQPGTQNPQLVSRIAKAVASPGFGIVLNVNRWAEKGNGGDEMVAPYTMHAQFDRAWL